MRNALGVLILAGGILSNSGVKAVAPFAMDVREPTGAFLNGVMPKVAPGPSGVWTTTKAFPNLTFQDPTFLLPEPGTTRLFVCGREGYVWCFTNDPATATKTVFLDLHEHTQGWDDCGVLGMAFHPEYGHPGSTNRGYVYVYYQYSTHILGSANARPPLETPAYNRLSRFTVPPGSSVADPKSELILFNQFDRHVWHNGGGMFFGPDGFLYLSNGDEGGPKDMYKQSQKINSGLFSGVLRIDVNQDPTKSHPIRRQPLDGGRPPSGWPSSSSGHYYIPNDNPFVNPDGSVLEEFWAIGFRSPHRLTYDAPSGRIWLGDVGQEDREELDLIEKAGNYQWPYMEGIIPGFRPKPAHLIGMDRPPIYDYEHENDKGCVICGYVYHGTKWASELGGKLLFGDNASGKISTLTYDGTNAPTVNYLCNMPPGENYAGGLSTFGLDHQQEIYMCAMGPNGQIFKLARSNSTFPEPPPLLSQVGAFADLNKLSAARGLIPYEVNMPLWSDGAVKRRWMAAPATDATDSTNNPIGFTPAGEWTFPAGTVFVKHFELPVDERNPDHKKRLETRLLVCDTNDTVYGVTYKWRADNSDADLLTNSLNENVVIASKDGSTRTQTWYYPSRQDCLTCHNPNAGYVLGVKTRQLNRDCTYPDTGRTDNQLRTWNHLKLFNPPIEENKIPGFAALASMTNVAVPLGERVRSYLDANCSQCHRPNGAQANFDARFSTPLASQGIISGVVNIDLGIPGAKVVAVSNLAQSVMFARMNTTGTNRMPPLARNVIDHDAVNALTEWISTAVPVGVLPPPWYHLDIGNVGFPGTASGTGDSFSVMASGEDIWASEDAFHYVFQPISGDFEIAARVVSIGKGYEWAKAGVMIRETLGTGSRYALMCATLSNGAAFQRRVMTGVPSNGSKTTSMRFPYWLRLVRKGGTFTGYYSKDGAKWREMGSDNINMSEAVYVGLAVTSHDNEATNHAVFDHINVGNPVPAARK